MNMGQWQSFTALIAGAVILAGCQTPGTAQSVIPVEECMQDADKPPRDFLVTIHVGASGTPLRKTGSREIAPGEMPRFSVERAAATPPGKVHIRFERPVDAPVTPFVGEGNARVHEFEVREPRTGRPWRAPFMARSTCDRVCTYDEPCKYTITYKPADDDYEVVLDPYIVIH